MKKEIKKAWVKALRSGKYKQGKGFLCKVNSKGEDRFCCLGVLADIAIEGEWNRTYFDDWSKEEVLLDEYNLVIQEGKSGNDTLSEVDFELLQELGLSYEDEQELIEMNDRGRKFSTIANWIEKNIPEDRK